MSFMNYIVQRLNDASDFFYDLYIEVIGWAYPFWLAAGPFYDICRVFNKLAWDFYDFGQWVTATADKLEDVLSWSYIKSLIRGWLPDLEDVISWWHSWTTWVRQRIDDWWYYTKNTVQGWIDIGDQWLRDLIDDANAWLARLQSTMNELIGILPGISELVAWFSNWWGNILSHLTTWWNDRILDVSNLINSAFTAREPFWSGWQDVKDNVIEFFSSPLDWLEDKFTNWFLGPEK